MGNIYPEKISSKNFEARLEQILSTPVDPENIDTYASEAIDELAGLAEDVTESYSKQPTIQHETARELEDSAFDYYHLGKIALMLDHMQAKEEELHEIDDFIARIDTCNEVFVPPDLAKEPIVAGSGNGIEEKKIIPRLKTLMFVLSNEFGLDIHDKQQVQLQTGVLENGMMRGVSYVMTEVPSLNRIVLTCDEEGNVTYVLDSDELAESGIFSEDITDLSKSELNELLAENSKLGQRMVYSSKYVQNIISALNDKFDNEGLLAADESSSPQTGQYLRAPVEPAPENYLSAYGIAEELGVSNKAISRIIEELGDDLGDTQNSRFGIRITKGYSPKQAEMIREKAEEKGLLALEAPEGYLSVRGIAKELGVSASMISKIITELGDELGDTPRLKFGKTITKSHSPKQAEMIREKAEEKGLLAPEAPEDYLSANGIAKELGVSHRAVSKIIVELGDGLGDAPRCKFGTQTAIGYSPEQVEMIRAKADEKGLLAPEAPEDYLSANGIVREFGVDNRSIYKIIAELTDELGDIQSFKFGPTVAIGYSPEQVEIIIQAYKSRGGRD